MCFCKTTQALLVQKTQRIMLYALEVMALGTGNQSHKASSRASSLQRRCPSSSLPAVPSSRVQCRTELYRHLAGSSQHSVSTEMYCRAEMLLFTHSSANMLQTRLPAPLTMGFSGSQTATGRTVKQSELGRK